MNTWQILLLAGFIYTSRALSPESAVALAAMNFGLAIVSFFLEKFLTK